MKRKINPIFFNGDGGGDAPVYFQMFEKLEIIEALKAETRCWLGAYFDKRLSDDQFEFNGTVGNSKDRSRHQQLSLARYGIRRQHDAIWHNVI